MEIVAIICNDKNEILPNQKKINIGPYWTKSGNRILIASSNYDRIKDENLGFKQNVECRNKNVETKIFYIFQ